MSQKLLAGDYLVFQLESGFGLLRVIAINIDGATTTWHLAAFDEFFIDVDHAEHAIGASQPLKVSHSHIALTDRAFESTQVARLANVPLTESETAGFRKWKDDPDREVSDRSVRLMLGLR